MFNLPKKTHKQYSTWYFTDSKLFIGRLQDGSTKLKYYYELPLPQGLIVNGGISNQPELVKFLTGIKTKLPPNEKYIVLGLSGQQCLTRLMSFPSLEIKEVDQAVKYQADNYFTLPLDQEYLDWMVLEEQNKKITKVLACTAPKSVVENYLTVFHQLLLYPIAFEPMPVAVYRVLPTVAKQTGLVVELTESGSNLLLVKDGHLIANSLVGSNEKISEVSGKMLDYYLNDIPTANRPKNLYLIGHQPTQEIINDLQVLGQVLLLKSNLKGLPTQRETELFSFGALCDKLVTPAEDIYSVNLLPKHLVTKYFQDNQTQKDKKYYLIIAILSALLFFGAVGALLLINRQIKLLESKTVVTGQQADIMANLMTYVPKVNVINRLPKNKQQLENLINGIYQVQTSAIITSLTYSSVKQEVIIAGLIDTRQGLIDYRDQLTLLGIFKKVSLPLSSLGKDGVSEFRLILSL